MKYYLRRHAIGPQVMVEIDQARYERLVASRRTLVDALSFEQRYELLLGNFTAFEMFCAELSVRSNFEFDFRYEIGRASCRERVCQYVEISVVAGSLKKKTLILC